MSIANWSETAADNGNSDLANGIDWTETMRPAQVAPSARATMAVMRRDLKAEIIDGLTVQFLPGGYMSIHGRIPSNGEVTFPYPFVDPPSVSVSLNAPYSFVYQNPMVATVAALTNSAIRVVVWMLETRGTPPLGTQLFSPELISFRAVGKIES